MFLCFILTPFVQFFFFFFTFLHKKSVSHIWQDIRSGVSMGVESLPESQAVWQVSGTFPAFFKVSCTPATWDIPPKSCCMREGMLQGIWLKHIEDNKSRPDSQSRHEPQPHTTATTCPHSPSPRLHLLLQQLHLLLQHLLHLFLQHFLHLLLQHLHLLLLSLKTAGATTRHYWHTFLKCAAHTLDAQEAKRKSPREKKMKNKQETFIEEYRPRDL